MGQGGQVGGAKVNQWDDWDLSVGFDSADTMLVVD